jgi:LuxR family maltose regulon positive regulatory protein
MATPPFDDAQDSTLLTTKLYIPPPLPNLVERPRLVKRLDEGLRLGHRLTLISAPAGFGKTTLLSEWIHSGVSSKEYGVRGEYEPVGEMSPTPHSLLPTPRFAWLSLDEGDNDLTRFLTYFIAALNRAEGTEATIGEGALGMLQSPQPPTEALLTSLINEVAAVPDRIILVLDDYHVIESSPVDNALTFTLEHLPPPERGLHLVIATREDPHLSLARLRARGQLTELRAADLRFTPDEVATFLNQVMGLNLSAEDIAALETRTEGWIAGLQLAALALQGTLSMRGREDVPGFIKAFAGDNRYIVDFLVEEVLQRQPEHVRSFLLRTSILDRLSGPLCDAVCFGMAEIPRQEDGRGMLEALERGNLFVVPLDDKRQWYRYHHLFADVLYTHLMEEQPDRVPTLHRRASEWYEREDLPADAVRHAIAAEDFERAAGLAELAWPAWSGSFQSIAWLGWVKDLPDELVRARPVLSVSYAWAFLNAGKLEAAEARLRDAERWLEPTTDMGERPEAPSTEACPFNKFRASSERSRRMVVVDEEQFRSLPASLATARAYHAQAIGDVPGTLKYTQRVLDLLPEGDSQWRGDATALLGLAYWASGDLEAAHRTFSDGLAGMKPFDVIVGTFVLADIKMTLGYLHEAVSACEHALQLATEHGEPMPLGTEDVYTGISGLHRERGDLEAAAQDLATSKKLGEGVELPDWQYRWCIAQARLNETLGDLDGALDLLDKAKRLYVRTPLPDVRPIAAMKTRVWVAQGRLTEALGWARERGLSVDDDLSYLREFEHVTLARVLIARHKSDRVDGSIHEAMGLIERLLQAAEEGGRTGSVIEFLVLQALAHHAQGDIPRALDPLERALTLAEPEGYVRIFVDEGRPMAALLREAAKHGIAPNYVSRLRAAFGKAEGTTPATQLLIEPLSERELEVLRLLGTELNGPEIARELTVSLNTMRTHTKNIYSKLGVNNRRAAVRRAEELDLL